MTFIAPKSVFAGNVNSKVQNLHKLETQYENQAKNYKSVVNNSIIYSKSGTGIRAKKEAGKSYEYFKKSVMPMVNQYEHQIYKPSAKSKVCLKSNQILPQNSYVFIFMSSSVPYTTWHNYAVAIDNLRRQGQGNIGLIIRGCIGGCKKVMPTINFIQRVIENKKLKVPILIDPLLFRLYDVTKVPTFVYAKNVQVLNPTISLGSSKNLKSHITAYKLIGDCG
ncbi:MAG: hypothetical protein GWP10_06280, partial [Nitrospiraceae bacterium]|nr:hypothetical protein [Nitrospiraceae bacterium]